MIVDALRNFTIDGKHTQVGFSVRHLMIARVRGRFNTVYGNIIVMAETMMPHLIDVVRQTSSIDTSEEQRDIHLRSTDFFDTKQYPTMSFRSSQVKGTLAGFEVDGELTLHGVTCPLSLMGMFEGSIKDPFGKDRIGFEASGTLSRKEFGLRWNESMEAGRVVVGDDISIEINVEAVA